jgi:hypothetical protein
MIFLTDPVSLGLLLLALVMTVYSGWKEFFRSKGKALES